MARNRAGLIWKGKDIEKIVRRASIMGTNRFALKLEGESKKELYPTHGVLTGTCRRSIHAGKPSYNWGGDDIEPDKHSPERGGAPGDFVEEVKRDLLLAYIGSGLVYSMPLHQGHHGFAGYHYITKPLERIKDDLLRFVKEAGKSLGLK